MTFERVQMLLEPKQRQALSELAQAQGKSVAQITRQAIDLGLQSLQQENELSRRQAALERARELRKSMPLLSIDVVEDMRQMREERDAEILGRH
jgi:hypothetical protein